MFKIMNVKKRERKTKQVKEKMKNKAIKYGRKEGPMDGKAESIKIKEK